MITSEFYDNWGEKPTIYKNIECIVFKFKGKIGINHDKKKMQKD